MKIKKVKKREGGRAQQGRCLSRQHRWKCAAYELACLFKWEWERVVEQLLWTGYDSDNVVEFELFLSNQTSMGATDTPWEEDQGILSYWIKDWKSKLNSLAGRWREEKKEETNTILCETPEPIACSMYYYTVYCWTIEEQMGLAEGEWRLEHRVWENVRLDSSHENPEPSAWYVGVIITCWQGAWRAFLSLYWRLPCWALCKPAAKGKRETHVN